MMNYELRITKAEPNVIYSLADARPIAHTDSAMKYRLEKSIFFHNFV